ncbi:3-deoxy-D-manno-octulosonic acid kinase [Szabonella alba]|uniref:3-deoxy-D-manno-octulosonic acid kinase n=1 Tax=Szabonella alba TaxID=2804194 RepID=UPI00307FF541
MRLGKTTHGGAVLWYDADLLDGMDRGLFDPVHLRRTGALLGQSQGRNAAYFLRHAGLELVLRHFWRGGLVGRINPDLFLRVPVARSRAMREFLLLDWMREQGLSVPRPVAAGFSPAGPFYRADILTERIPDSRTMADCLSEAPLPPEIWGAVGDMVGRMHRLGVHHSDLNCRNILLTGDGAVWLIDFDKCDRRAPGDWVAANLARLKRSFEKEKRKVPGLHWDDAVWQALCEGHAKALAD